jgi:hypothetical protein
MVGGLDETVQSGARFVCLGPSVVGSDTHRGLLSKCDIPSASEWVAYYIMKEVCLLIQSTLHGVATGEGAEESRPRAGGSRKPATGPSGNRSRRVRTCGRRHGRRADRRCAVAWSPEQLGTL